MNQQTIDNALECCRLVKGDKVEFICGFTPAIYWLSSLHNELASKGDIPHFKETGRDKMMLLWTQVCILIPGKPKFIRVLSCFAIYMFTLLTENNELYDRTIER